MIRFFEKWIFPGNILSWQEKLVTNHPLVASFRPFSLIGMVLFFHGVLWVVGYCLPETLGIHLVSVYYSFLLLLVALIVVFFGTIVYLNRSLKQLEAYPLRLMDRGLLFILGFGLSLICFTLPFSGAGALLTLQQSVYQAEKTGEDIAKFQLLVEKYPFYSQGEENQYLKEIGHYRNDNLVDYLAPFNQDSFKQQYIVPALEKTKAEYQAIEGEEEKIKYLDELGTSLLQHYRITFSEKCFSQLKDRLSMAVIANTQPVFWSNGIIYCVLLLGFLFACFVAYTNFKEVATVAGVTVIMLGLVMILLQLLIFLLSTLGVSGITIPYAVYFPMIVILLSIPLVGIFLQIRQGYQLRLSHKMLVFYHFLLIGLVVYYGENSWINLISLGGSAFLIILLSTKLKNLPIQQMGWGFQRSFNKQLLVKNLAANYPLLWDAHIPLAIVMSAGLFLLSLFLGLSDASTPLEILNASSMLTGTNYIRLLIVGLVPFVLWVRRFNDLRYPNGLSRSNYLRLSIAITGMTLFMFLSLSPYHLLCDAKLKKAYTKEILKDDLQALVTVDELINDNFYFNRLSALGISSLNDTVENNSLFEQLDLHTFTPDNQLDSNEAKLIFVRYGITPPQPFQFSSTYNSPYKEARDSLSTKMNILLNKQFLAVKKEGYFIYSFICIIMLVVFLVLFKKGLALRYWTGLYLLGFFFSVLDTYNVTKAIWNQVNLLLTGLMFFFLLGSIYYQARHPHKKVSIWRYVSIWLLGYNLFINYVESLGMYGQKLWHFPALFIMSVFFFLLEHEVRRRIIYMPQGTL